MKLLAATSACRAALRSLLKSGGRRLRYGALGVLATTALAACDGGSVSEESAMSSSSVVSSSSRSVATSSSQDPDTPLPSEPRLTELTFVDNTLADCIRGSGYEYPSQVTYLRCLGVQDTRDLAYLPQLQQLELVAGTMSALDLRQNSELQILTLKESDQLEHIEFSPASKLVELTVFDAALVTVKASAMPQLTSVSLVGTPQLQFFDTHNMPALQSLILDSEVLQILDVSENSALATLSVSRALGLSHLVLPQEATNLEHLHVSSSLINSLNLINFTALESVFIGANAELTDIQWGQHNQLAKLRLESVPVTLLDLSRFPNLTDLTLSDLQLQHVDITSNAQLVSVSLLGRSIESFDFNVLPSGDINISRTGIANLDMSQLSGLDVLTLVGNKQLTELDLTSNPAINTITAYANGVERITVPQSKLHTNLIILENPIACESALALYQSINQWDSSITIDIPEPKVCGLYPFTDDIALTQCIYDTGLEPAKITRFQCKNVRNASGISALTALEDLTMSGKFAHLDTSALVHLVRLDVDSELLQVLDVSHNKALVDLRVESRALDQLDLGDNHRYTHINIVGTQLNQLNLSDQTQLERLDVWSASQLSALELPKTETLAYLGVSGSALVELDISDNPQIQELYARSTKKLEALELAIHSELTHLDLEASAITSVDLTSAENLAHLNLQRTAVTELDLSQNPYIETFDFREMKLSTLDLSDNQVLTSLNFDGLRYGRPDRLILENTAIESLSVFGTHLVSLELSGSTALKELTLGGHSLSTLDLSELNQLVSLSLSQSVEQLVWPDVRLISHLALIGDAGETINFSDIPQLRSLSLRDASLDILMEGGLSQLEVLTVERGGPVGDLNLSQLPNLKVLSMVLNEPVTMDLQSNAALETIDVSVFAPYAMVLGDKPNLLSLKVNAPLSDIDLAFCPQLEALELTSMNLLNIDLSLLPQLKTLRLSGDFIESVDLSQNTQLQTLSLFLNNLKSIALEGLDELTALSLSSDRLTSIDISQNRQLKMLWLYLESVKSLDLSKLTVLSELVLKLQSLEGLDLSYNQALTDFTLFDSRLSELDVSALDSLEALTVIGANSIVTLDLSALMHLRRLVLRQNSFLTCGSVMLPSVSDQEPVLECNH